MFSPLPSPSLWTFQILEVFHSVDGGSTAGDQGTTSTDCTAARLSKICSLYEDGKNVSRSANDLLQLSMHINGGMEITCLIALWHIKWPLGYCVGKLFEIWEIFYAFDVPQMINIVVRLGIKNILWIVDFCRPVCMAVSAGSWSFLHCKF